ncbi:U6 snRNA phosphodiesterase 1 [Bactrocera neohumeralis]|uniref:U6 snRNA phosphodiesterase n=1 Tax=Bactrocera tryoni TaxID=59916 RepID=UPI001A96F8E0|nr:U6 snRNA phosphodiesterase [Bactrocera tryoni]XP_039967260.1 U6 snRNA phosphodiesterase [Bactrocera tryoni]XP_050322279.1 U6 snRNA phosphodiesterase 1 [Bactrocera neohumeralis]XP_050322281.1 U6 snRNA phosphodiesterase 1 [Bactrocera neohumeralis]
MALVNYDSSCSSDESNDDCHKTSNRIEEITGPKSKIARLTQPTELKRTLPCALSLLGVKPANSVPKEAHLDNPEKHNGRIRSFKHERGNWATYVHIPVRSEQLEDIQEVSQDVLADVIKDLHAIEDLHISLSRTVVLQHHHIDSFVESLKTTLEINARFSISLRRLHFYTNAERTRTFIALKVDNMHYDKVHKLMEKVDVVMTEYRLQRFYEEPSFHISFLWCLGDKVSVLNEYLDTLESAINVVLGESNVFSLFIKEIICKSGNKEFIFKLK